MNVASWWEGGVQQVGLGAVLLDERQERDWVLDCVTYAVSLSNTSLGRTRAGEDGWH